MNLYEFLVGRFAHRIDHVALREPGGHHLTYADLDSRAARYAAVLRDSGVKPGDRVIVQVPKSTENVALYLGALRAGAVFVTLNTAYTDNEVAYFIEDADPSLIVAGPEATVQTGAATLTLDEAGRGTAAEAADAADPFDDIVTRADNDPAAMLYTSGTTGRSKGAVLSHAALVSNGLALHDIWHFEADDVLVHILPIFHVHGLFVALHCAFMSASTAIFLPRFDVDSVLEQLPNATAMMGVPTHYSRLLADDRFEPSVCKSIRLFTSGSAPMTETVHQDFEQRTGQRIVERYGMTEAGIITSNPYDGDRIAGTVGYPLPGFELRVCDDAGTEVPQGETGTVEVRGPGLFNGYRNKPEQTAEAYHPGGWFITGDVGAVSPDGRVTLEGRQSDMIISGGLNVYPKEIEIVLDEAPGVVESAVVGLPHPDFGEAVAAFIVGEAPSDALDELLSGELASFKRPKLYVSVDELPRNAMGKVQKHLLRTEHAAHFTTD